MKTRPVGAELFHADGRTDGRTDEQTDRQTDMTKLIEIFESPSVTVVNEAIKYAGTAKMITITLHKHCIKYSADILLLLFYFWY